MLTFDTHTLSSIVSHSFSIAKSKESLPLCLMSSKCSCSIIPLHHAPLLQDSIVLSWTSLLFSSSEESKSCSETKNKIGFCKLQYPSYWPQHTRLLGITDYRSQCPCTVRSEHVLSWNSYKHLSLFFCLKNTRCQFCFLIIVTGCALI